MTRLAFIVDLSAVVLTDGSNPNVTTPTSGFTRVPIMGRVSFDAGYSRNGPQSDGFLPTAPATPWPSTSCRRAPCCGPPTTAKSTGPLDSIIVSSDAAAALYSTVPQPQALRVPGQGRVGMIADRELHRHGPVRRRARTGFDLDGRRRPGERRVRGPAASAGLTAGNPEPAVPERSHPTSATLNRRLGYLREGGLVDNRTCGALRVYSLTVRGKWPIRSLGDSRAT